MGKENDSNYSHHCLSGTYEISGHLIFVDQSVPVFSSDFSQILIFETGFQKINKYQIS